MLFIIIVSTPAYAQTLTIYTDESSYDAAIPAGSLSTVENFAGVTSNTNVSQSTPDIWNGFTLLASGNSINFGDSRYCLNLAASSCVGYNNNTPALNGITAAMGAPGFYGGGQLFFTPTNPAFAIGMSNIDWNDSTQRSAIEITFSNNTTDIYIRPAQGVGPPPEFVGFKIDAVSISSGIYITSLRWYGISNQELIGIWNVKTSSPPPADPMIVTSTADTNTVGTLRYALNWANANADDDNITFDIPGAGPHVISLASALPIITDDNVSVNGISQSGASCGDLWNGTPHTLVIELNATNAFTALEIGADNVNIRGLSITGANRKVNFNNSSSNGSVTCSYLGLGIDGIAGGGNQGVVIGGTNNIAGGGDTSDGNVISGNLFNGVIVLHGGVGVTVQGNFIGTSPDGTAIEANGYSGVGGFDYSSVASINEIRGNLISGNTQHGIHFNDDSTFTGSIGDIIIAGNYIGLARTGGAALPNGDHGIYFENGSTSGVTIGGTSTADRNVISGNDDYGIYLDNVSDTNLLGNYIGVGVNGTTDLGNNDDGVYLTNTSNISIGDATANGRNVIGGNEGVGIASYNTTTDLSILGNYIGLDYSGNVALANGTNKAVDSRHAIEVTNGTANNVTISDNVIGGYDRTGIIFFDVTGSNNLITGNNIGVGADDLSDISTGQRFEFAVIGIGGVTNGGSVGLTIGGTTSGDANLVANGSNAGIFIYQRTDVDILGNTIRDNTNDGINIGFGGAASITGNSIFNNGGLGIDLNADGVTANDNGDGDTGPNDLLNFPVLNDVLTDGSTEITYNFNLDVPNEANGYRIDFYKNSAADPSGFGEGQIHLGSVDISHAGGDLNFAGTFTSLAPVSFDDFISTTTTRKTGPLTYDVTSEFSETEVAENVSPAALVVEKTVAPLEPAGYSLPDTDVVYTFSVTNTGDGSVDADTIVIIDEMPSDVEFFYGDFDGAGPSTDVIGFAETGTTLTFNPSVDAAFSNSGTKPANMSECNYTPVAGYDSNVTYICLNPKGQMLGGAPDPTFSMSFRSRIK